MLSDKVDSVVGAGENVEEELSVPGARGAVLELIDSVELLLMVGVLELMEGLYWLY